MDVAICPDRISRKKIARRPAVERLESRQLLTAAPAAAGVFANVPEAGAFKLVYDLDVPEQGGAYNTRAVPYSVNNAAQIKGPFDRVAYYIELVPKAGGAGRWVYVSADAFTQNAAQLGVPTAASGASFQLPLTRMNVFSNDTGVTIGSNLAGGNLEFWPNSYQPAAPAATPGASSTLYDFGDTPYGPKNGWGSMQINNTGAKQTVLAYNDWGGLNPTQPAEIGIGNNPQGNPDWTGKNTADQYAVRRLQVLVHPTGATPTATPIPSPTSVPVPTPNPPPAPIPHPTPASPTLTVLPLGDSITWGYQSNGAQTGGYRSRLYQDFLKAGQKVHFVGSVVDTRSPYMTGVGENRHEGHGSYRIDQIAANLDAVGPFTPVSPNNGGHWLDGTSARTAVNPDVILLQAGTNDILQNATGDTAAKRMDALIDHLTRDRPKTDLIVAAITPINNAAQNKQVVAYNNLLKTVVIPKYQKLGRRVTLVDQYHNFVDAAGKITAARLPDHVHPDRTGYDRIGDTWYQGLQAVVAMRNAAAAAVKK